MVVVEEEVMVEKEMVFDGSEMKVVIKIIEWYYKYINICKIFYITL